MHSNETGLGFRLKAAWIAFLFIAAAVPVFGHPGHSLSDAGVSHLLTSADHAGSLIFVAAMSFVLASCAANLRGVRWCKLCGFSSLVAAALVSVWRVSLV